MSYDLKKIASNFQIEGSFIEASPYGTGHINETFAATFNLNGTPIRYTMQGVNTNVFKDPLALMENIKRVTDHIQEKTAGEPSRRTMLLIPTKTGDIFYSSGPDDVWRIYNFIEKATTYDIVETAEQAFQAARAFGDFQKMLLDLPGERLHETIPDFHNTPLRFQALMEAIDRDPINRARSAAKEIDFALNRQNMTGILAGLLADGSLPERITHNDTKLNNVLLDDRTGEGVCVIDLDTVMPGLIHYDFGDMVRTTTCPAAEDEQDLSKVYMQQHMFAALLNGYLESAGEFLTKTEREYLPFSGKLISFEIGIRFLTDHLLGDTYFKIHREGHNLDRCRTQFKLVESIEEQEDELYKLL